MLRRRIIGVFRHKDIVSNAAQAITRRTAMVSGRAIFLGTPGRGRYTARLTLPETDA